MLGAVQVQNQQCGGLIPGVIILYNNKFQPFNFTAELKAGRHYTPGPAELGAATDSALSYLRPAFHSAFLPLLLWWLKIGIWGIF